MAEIEAIEATMGVGHYGKQGRSKPSFAVDKSQRWVLATVDVNISDQPHFISIQEFRVYDLAASPVKIVKRFQFHGQVTLSHGGITRAIVEWTDQPATLSVSEKTTIWKGGGNPPEESSKEYTMSVE